MKRTAISLLSAALFCTVGITNAFATDEVKSPNTYSAKDLEPHGWSVMLQGATFSKISFTETLDKLNELGVKEIEMFRGQKIGGGIPGKTEYTSITEEAKEYIKRITAEKGITISHYGVARGTKPGHWRKLFQFCKDLGIKALITEPEYDELPMVDKLAQEFDIRVGIHNHALPTKYWNPDIVLHHMKKHKLSNYIGISGDTGNWARSGLNPLECIKKLRAIKGRIVEIQIKDMIGGRYAPLGIGEGNVAGILRELKRQEYKGPLLFEYFGRSPTRFDEVKESLNYIYRVSHWMNRK